MKSGYKIVRPVAVAICVILILAGLHAPTVYAASGNVSIAVSASQLNVGDTLTVTVSLSSDAPIGAYSMAVSYNASVLEYTGGDGNGGGGTVSIAGYGDGTTTRLSARLTFRAIANGSASIATSGNDAYAYDESALAMSHASAVVNVVAPAAATTAENTNSNSNNNASTEAVESKDTSLKSLEISPGTLVPAFSPTVKNYSVTLPKETKSIVVSALAKDSTASVTVSHNNDLEPGVNRTYIVVTATNGAQTTYVLNVTCGEPEDNSEFVIQIDGEPYTPIAKTNMGSITIPSGFSETVINYQNQEILAYETSDHTIQIVYLLTAEKEGSWFVYDADTDEFYPYVEISIVLNRYIILGLPKNVKLPEGYQPVDLNINGQSVVAYSKNAQDDYVLVYATNLQSPAGLYMYDKVESNFWRYREEEATVTTEEMMTIEEVTESATEAVTESDVAESRKLERVRALLYIVCVIVVLLLIVLVVMIIIMNKRLSVLHTDGTSASNAIGEPVGQHQEFEDED